MLKVTTSLTLTIFLLAGCLHTPRLQFPPPTAPGVDALVQQARSKLHQEGNLAGAASAARGFPP